MTPCERRRGSRAVVRRVGKGALAPCHHQYSNGWMKGGHTVGRAFRAPGGLPTLRACNGLKLRFTSG